MVTDLTSISAALQSLKTASDIAKHINASVKTLEDAKIKLQLAELTDALADLKIALADVKEENVELKDEINELKNKENLRHFLLLKDNAYWANQEPIEGYGSGPWCSNCFDSEGVLITLHHKLASAIAVGNAGFSSYKWKCPKCKADIRASKPDEL